MSFNANYCTSTLLQLSLPCNVWFGLRANLKNLSVKTILFRHALKRFSCRLSCAISLGVLFNFEISMKQHVVKVAATCFYHLRRLRPIRRCVGAEVTTQLVLAFITILARLLQLRLGQASCSPYSSLYNEFNSKADWFSNWELGKMLLQDCCRYIGYPYVGEFRLNSVRWCTRYTWQDAQPAWTTVHWIPACGHQQLIFTSPHDCASRQVSKRSRMHGRETDLWSRSAWSRDAGFIRSALASCWTTGDIQIVYFHAPHSYRMQSVVMSELVTSTSSIASRSRLRSASSQSTIWTTCNSSQVGRAELCVRLVTLRCKSSQQIYLNITATVAGFKTAVHQKLRLSTMNYPGPSLPGSTRPGPAKTLLCATCLPGLTLPGPSAPGKTNRKEKNYGWGLN